MLIMCNTKNHISKMGIDTADQSNSEHASPKNFQFLVKILISKTAFLNKPHIPCPWRGAIASYILSVLLKTPRLPSWCLGRSPAPDKAITETPFPPSAPRHTVCGMPEPNVELEIYYAVI